MNGHIKDIEAKIRAEEIVRELDDLAASTLRMHRISKKLLLDKWKVAARIIIDRNNLKAELLSKELEELKQIGE